MTRSDAFQSGYLNNAERIYNFDVRYQDDDHRDEDLKGVCRALYKEEWGNLADPDISIKTVTGGITNCLYHVSTESLEGDGGVLVRIYGANTEVVIDREMENRLFAELSSLGFAPKFFGRFNNGRVEEFLPARALESKEMGSTQPVDFVALIAQEVARLHSLEVKGAGEKKALLWDRLRHFLKLASDVKFDKKDQQEAFMRLDLPSLGQQIDWVERTLCPEVRASDGTGTASEDAPKAFLREVVFGHQDLLSGNILYCEGWDRVQIIDYEYGGNNYRGYDIANHFFEHMGFECNKADYPSEAVQNHFLEQYMQRTAPDMWASVDKEGWLNCMRRDLAHFTLASDLLWGIWAVIQARYSSVDFDFLDYSRLRLEAYASHKHRLGSLPDSGGSIVYRPYL